MHIKTINHIAYQDQGSSCFYYVCCPRGCCIAFQAVDSSVCFLSFLNFCWWFLQCFHVLLVVLSLQRTCSLTLTIRGDSNQERIHQVFTELHAHTIRNEMECKRKKENMFVLICVCVCVSETEREMTEKKQRGRNYTFI